MHNGNLLDMLFGAWLEAHNTVRDARFPTAEQLQLKHTTAVRYLQTMLEVEQAKTRLQAKVA